MSSSCRLSSSSIRSNMVCNFFLAIKPSSTSNSDSKNSSPSSVSSRAAGASGDNASACRSVISFSTSSKSLNKSEHESLAASERSRQPTVEKRAAHNANSALPRFFGRFGFGCRIGIASSDWFVGAIIMFGVVAGLVVFETRSGRCLARRRNVVRHTGFGW